MKKFALIGAGGYAAIYVQRFLELHRQRKLSFCGIVIRPQDRPQVTESLKAVTEAGISVFDDKESLYRDAAPDVVALPVAIGAHCPLALDAVSRGIQVMVEKPAAGSVAEIDQMMDAEKRTGKFIAVGFQHLYAPDIRELKERLSAGEFGAVRRIAVVGVWPRGNDYYRRNDWVCRLRGAHGEAIYDSPANNAFAHYLNLPLFLASAVRENSAHAVEMQAELYRTRREIETFDTCAIRLKTENKVEILTLFTHASQEVIQPCIRLETECGTVEWSEAAAWKFTSRSGETVLPAAAASDGRENMFSLLIRKAEGEKVSLCPLAVAREHTFCIEAVHRHFSVSELPETVYRVDPKNGIHEIFHIAGDFQNCFDRFLLPSECGVSWSVPSELVSIG